MSPLYRSYKYSRTVYFASLTLLQLVYSTHESILDIQSSYQLEGMTDSRNVTVCTRCHLTGTNFQDLNFRSLNSDISLRRLSVVNSPYLTKIQEGVFNIHQLKNVFILELVKNSIREIKINAFQGLENLEHLYINNCKLKTIVPRHFGNLKKLRILSLENNLLNFIDGYEFNSEYFPNLTHLNLNGNMIESLNDTINNLSHLIGLDLGNNKITKLEKFNFVGLRRLLRLDLQNNNITVLHANVFHHLDQLGYLDLSGNQITTIETGALINLRHLTNLNLSNNNLTAIRRGMFQGLASLINIDLDKNNIRSPWHDGLADDMPHLKIVKLGGEIINVDRIW